MEKPRLQNLFQEAMSRSRALGLAQEIALTALGLLNSIGKMLGIIGHTETIKELIPAQIRIERGGGIGHSRIAR